VVAKRSITKLWLFISIPVDFAATALLLPWMTRSVINLSPAQQAAGQVYGSIAPTEFQLSFSVEL
jgi:hypothetical protein